MLNIENGQGATALDQTQWIDQRQGYAVIPSSGSLGTQCEVSINTGTLGTGNNTLSVASGSVLFAGGSVSVSAQNVDIDAGDSSPRKDVIYIDSAGAAQVRKGSPAGVPADAPGNRFQTWLPAPYDMHDVDSVVLAVVWVPAGASSVTASDLRDRRLPADGAFSAATISGNVPALQLDGTETGAQTLSIRENAGAIELFDHGAMATASTWDLDPPLENASLAQVDQSRDLQPEGEQAGLAADATGVKYEGAMRQQLDSWLLTDERAVYIEAATTSSANDETVTVEVYDDTAAAVAASATITGGSPRTRSTDVSGSLTAGNEVHVRWNVTTASATGGATFDAVGARLIVE